MILLANFKISEARLVGHHNRGNLKHYPERIDITKYTLASYAPVLPLISKVVLYIAFDKECEHHKPALETFIKELFPKDKLILRWHRNTKIQDWRNSYIEDIEPIDDNLIFNLGNDDHLFFDSNLTVLEKSLENLKNCSDPYAHLMYSHYSEQLRLGANAHYALTEDLSCIYGRTREMMATDVMKKERWKHYWFDFDFNDGAVGIDPSTPYLSNVANGDKFFRTDVLIETNVLPNGATQFVPIRELVRHFDGYNNTADWNNLAPPLEIPDGFFENQIKIAYGYDSVREGWTNINPAYPNYKSHSSDGMDYKFALEDIPMVWKGKISQIDINPAADLEALREARDKHLYDKAFYPISGKHITTVNAYPSNIFKDQFISQLWIENSK